MEPSDYEKLKKSGTFYCKPGFTLLELLLAITILASIIGILYATFWGSMNNTERVRETSRIYHSGRLILGQLISDLESTYYDKSLNNKRGDSEKVDVFKGEQVTGDRENERTDKLSFLTTSGSILDSGKGESLLLRVSYFLEPNKDSGGYSLVRRAVPYVVGKELSEKDEERISEYDFVLSRNIKSFQLEYMDLEGDKNESWDSSGISTRGIPSEVAISITLDNPVGEPVTLSTRVFIPVSLLGK